MSPALSSDAQWIAYLAPRLSAYEPLPDLAAGIASVLASNGGFPVLGRQLVAQDVAGLTEGGGKRHGYAPLERLGSPPVPSPMRPPMTLVCVKCGWLA